MMGGEIGRRGLGSCAGWALSWICCTSLCCTSVSAIDWYVNNVKGDDGRDGRAEVVSGSSGPFQTIARALRAARAGDRIVLAATGEPYRESITLQGGHHSGIGRAPFALVGNGAVLDGRARVPAGVWEHVSGHVFRFRPARMSFQTLYIGDALAERVAADRTSETLPELAPLQWCLHRGWIYFRTENNKLPSAYELYHGGESVGITLYEVRNVIIMDLTVRGFQLDGINAHDGAYDIMLAGVHSEGNGRSGISVGGASRVSLWRCAAKDNGVAQLRAESYAKVFAKDCQFEGAEQSKVRSEDHAVIDVEQP